MGCESNGIVYAEGSFACVGGRELECTREGWVDTGRLCRTKEFGESNYEIELRGPQLPASDFPVTYTRFDQATMTQYVELVNRSGRTADVVCNIFVNGTPAHWASWTFKNVGHGEARTDYYRLTDYGYGSIAYQVVAAYGV